MNVTFYEAFEEEAGALKKYLPPSFKADYTWKTIQESGDAEPRSRVISVRTQSRFPARWASSLDAILTRSTGYDHVLAYRQSVSPTLQCGYLPEYCSRAVAEHAMLLWTALLRRLPLQLQQFHLFNRDGLTGAECEGRRLLVVGVGHIGSQIAAIGRGLGMDVRGVDLIEKHPEVTYVTIDEGLPWADVVVCAMNLTRMNPGYFDYRRLQKAKKGLIFVNIARGELSPCEGLRLLVEEGHLGGLGLDVYAHESELAVSLRSGKPSDSKEAEAVFALQKGPNVLFTPHNAFNSQEAVARKAEHSVRQLVHFRETGQFLWVVPLE